MHDLMINTNNARVEMHYNNAASALSMGRRTANVDNLHMIPLINDYGNNGYSNQDEIK